MLALYLTPAELEADADYGSRLGVRAGTLRAAARRLTAPLSKPAGAA